MAFIFFKIFFSVSFLLNLSESYTICTTLYWNMFFLQVLHRDLHTFWRKCILALISKPHTAISQNLLPSPSKTGGGTLLWARVITLYKQRPPAGRAVDEFNGYNVASSESEIRELSPLPPLLFPHPQDTKDFRSLHSFSHFDPKLCAASFSSLFPSKNCRDPFTKKCSLNFKRIKFTGKETESGFFYCGRGDFWGISRYIF